SDIGVAQPSSTPTGHSLQRGADGVWEAPAPSSFGRCNGTAAPPGDGGETGEIVINELMGEPVNAESASWGEWFEVHNPGSAAIDLLGWTISSGGQPDHVIATSVVVPAGGYVVLGRGADVARNGGVDLDYNYFTGSATTIWLDATDWLVLRDGTGATADSVAWTSLARGSTRGVRDPATANQNVDGSNWGYATVQFGAGDYGTPGAANGTLSDTPPAVWTITFAGRDGGDPPLPVGFEDQIFATLRDPLGNEVATTFTWSSETPALASVDQLGVVRALGAGAAIIRATAENGTTRTYALDTHIAAPGGTAAYDGNTEFGEPVDADAGDDFIVRRDQYTASYSYLRGTPNWVSYNLEATHFGTADRCDCFTHDPELPAGFTALSTADYTGAGTYHGFGIDRGHLVRSADRTAGSLDNAVTYYFSNIIPQAADMNQGPWSDLETMLGDRARDGASEIYIISGVAGSSGTLKDEGRIVIPESVWKVAVILPRDHGLDDVTHWSDLEVIAVMMPNTPGVRDMSWTDFDTSIDAIEAASGYDLLALLPDDVEFIIESGMHELLTVFSDAAASGALTNGARASLTAKLDAAANSIARGQTMAAMNQIGAFRNELVALVRTGRIPAEMAQVLLDAAQRVVEALSD
ncbi:MAG TPA: DNA/RNA non-specific endonuclease, partial [Longimicrobiales bacterium]|nr:DNA/RNA non-specific endonuclease [Longimicrobiales bacterium]